MTTMTNWERVDRLVEIKEEVKDLIDEAMQLLREGGAHEERALRYWYAAISCQLDNDHGYMGREMCTLQDSIDECIDECAAEGEVA